MSPASMNKNKIEVIYTHTVGFKSVCEAQTTVEKTRLEFKGFKSLKAVLANGVLI